MQPFKDDIEQLFQDGISERNFAFDESAWAKMEKKLDGTALVSFSYWKILYPLTVVLLFLGTWYFIGDSQDSSEKSAIGHEIEASMLPEAQASAQQSSEVTDPKLAKSETSAVYADGAEKGNVDESDETIGQMVKVADNSNLRSSNEERSEVESKTPDKDLKNDEMISVRADDHSEVDAQIGSSSLEALQSATLSNSDEVKRNKQLAYLNHLGWITLPGPTLAAPTLDTAQLDTEGQVIISKSRLLFGLVIANDWSAVGVSDFSNSGPSIGISIEYQILKRLSITTGAHIGSKKYSALGEEYWRPRWMNRSPGNEISTIAANCRVVDIPINVNYHFQPKGLNQFSIGTGLSSYIMLREDYNYTYAFADPNLPDSWRWENRNKHYFSIVNLTASYRRQLSDKLLLGIEPYIKVPLTDIGIGEVDLFSFGTAVSLKFKK